MKFGLFYELQLPKPYDKKTWNPEDEHRRWAAQAGWRKPL